MQEEIEFVRLVGNERRVGSHLGSVSQNWQGKKQRFLMISPHDDDAVLGAGLLIQLAKREKLRVKVSYQSAPPAPSLLLWRSHQPCSFVQIRY